MNWAGDIQVVMTPHFLDRFFYREHYMPKSEFFDYLPYLYHLGSDHIGRDCIITIGNGKIVFTVETDGIEFKKMVMITCMPKDYKQNQINKIKTTDLGRLRRIKGGNWELIYPGSVQSKILD